MEQTNLPTSQSERIASLDILRGFAILGILLMNIQSLSMPSAAYSNPMAYGDFEGLNHWAWVFSHFFADQKFMAIFSSLFGAGVILITERAEAKTGKSAALHYKRTFWLLLIGLIHAHLIWYGDVLVAYALCGFFVYLLRKRSARTLFILGLLLVSVHSFLYLLFGLSLPEWPKEAVESTQKTWLPAAAATQKEIAAITGSLSAQLQQNSTMALMLETVVFVLLFVWRAGGLMLVGMGLYKWGVFSAKKSKAFYLRGFLLSWATGLPIIGYGYLQNKAVSWSFEYSMFLGSQYNYWGSLLVAFGYICAVMWFSKSTALPWLKERLAAIGKMALTNYIAQSIFGVILFYGVGFGLFGQVERRYQLLIVFAIWGLQLAYSKPWLAHFRFGPLEWAWRSLTYGKMQPMRKKK